MKAWLEQIKHVCALNKSVRLVGQRQRHLLPLRAIRIPLLKTSSTSCLERWRQELQFLEGKAGCHSLCASEETGHHSSQSTVRVRVGGTGGTITLNIIGNWMGPVLWFSWLALSQVHIISLARPTSAVSLKKGASDSRRVM